jgi:hypothetical protein
MSAELCAPLKVVDALFESRRPPAGEQPPLEWGERAHFVQALGLNDEENFAKIPCLNDIHLVQSVPPFSLVRYRALVQDVFEPEVYSTVLVEHAANPAGEAASPPRLVTTKYRECVEPLPGKRLEDVGPRGFGQRGACYCVPIPGETRWAKDAAAAWARERGAPDISAVESKNVIPSSVSKRSRPDEDVDMSADASSASNNAGYCAGEQQLKAASGNRKPLGNSKPRSAPPAADVGPTGLCSAEDFGLNFPLPWEEQRGRGESTACMVKLYDEEAEAVRVNETIEVVGILCVNPELASFDNTPLAESEMFRDARQPASSLVPRLHAILVRRLPFYHPLLPYSVDWLNEARLAAAYSNSFSTPGALDAIWRAALAQITGQLSGDTLAAQYLLLQCVSRAFAKHSEQNLGSWTLALTKWPQVTSVQNLKEALQELSPRVVHLPITAETLNTQKWRPRKDNIANRLVAGQLQLAPGTLLLLDETSLGEGQLAVDGVKSMTAIGTLVSEMILSCDFEYQEAKIPLEVSPVVVSPQKRPVVAAAGVCVPMRPDANAATAAASHPKSCSLIDATRLLMALVTRSPKPLKIPTDVVNRFSEDFSRVRQEFNVPSELCNTWMCLARAWCLWHGESELSLNRWQEVLEIERQRLLRCQAEGLFSPDATGQSSK